jgi:hypothetical protein
VRAVGICAWLGLFCLTSFPLRAAGDRPVVIDGVTLDFPAREVLVHSSSWSLNGRRHFDLLTTDVDSLIRLRFYSETGDGLAGLNYHTTFAAYAIDMPKTFPFVEEPPSP